MTALRTLIVATFAGALLLPAPAAFGAGDLLRTTPVRIRIDLGKAGVAIHKAYPDKITVETGKLHKLTLYNPTKVPHYFTSPRFASKIWTFKVQIKDKLGKGSKILGKVRGKIEEVEVYAGQVLEWWFVPVSTGTFTARCRIRYKDKKSHSQKGERVTITIK
jgi:uncharacterized cupredoxin-like copper-binding protein